jgi:signal transduction histidine kinase
LARDFDEEATSMTKVLAGITTSIEGRRRSRDRLRASPAGATRAAEFEERTAALEREREQRTRAAIAEERKRIGRELHDMIAHIASVMTVQAGAARLLLDEDPERAMEPVRSSKRRRGRRS